MMPIYLTHEAKVKEWLNLAAPMIRITTYRSLAKFCDMGHFETVCMGRLLIGRFVIGTFNDGMFSDWDVS